MNEEIITLLIFASFVLLVAWIMIPFLIIGVSNRLDRLIKLMEQEKKIE